MLEIYIFFLRFLSWNGNCKTWGSLFHIRTVTLLFRSLLSNLKIFGFAGFLQRFSIMFSFFYLEFECLMMELSTETFVSLNQSIFNLLFHLLLLKVYRLEVEVNLSYKYYVIHMWPLRPSIRSPGVRRLDLTLISSCMDSSCSIYLCMMFARFWCKINYESMKTIVNDTVCNNVYNFSVGYDKWLRCIM